MQAPDNAKVLELAVGSAKLWKVNCERIVHGWDITLSDISEGMLEDAKKNLEDMPRGFSSRVVDAQQIPFEVSSFDVILANHVLYHVPDVDKAISEICRVLKSGGRFYATTNGLTHMKELDEFVETYLSPKLQGVFVRLDSTTEQFALENGTDKLKKHFHHVRLHYPPESYLHVTEAKPFIDYILSMARWSELVAEASREHIEAIVQEATAIAESSLPIHITTSTGLFEAS